MMLEKMNLARDINKCYARLSWFVCCRYLDSCLRRCSQLFCSNNFALPNTNIDCETNWNTNQERNTDRDCDKYKMFDSCLRRCSQLFWSSDFASAVASCSFVPFQFLNFFLQGISIRPQHSILPIYWYKDKLKYWHKYKLKLWHKCNLKLWQKYKLKSWHIYKYKSWQIQNAAVQWLCVGHDPGVTRQGCSLAQGWRGQGSLLQTQKYTNT